MKLLCGQIIKDLLGEQIDVSVLFYNYCSLIFSSYGSDKKQS